MRAPRYMLLLAPLRAVTSRASALLGSPAPTDDATDAARQVVPDTRPDQPAPLPAVDVPPVVAPGTGLAEQLPRPPEDDAVGPTNSPGPDSP